MDLKRWLLPGQSRHTIGLWLFVLCGFLFMCTAIVLVLRKDSADFDLILILDGIKRIDEKDSYMLQGTLVLKNNTKRQLQVQSGGSWLQYVEFHFFDLDGRQLPSKPYGPQFSRDLLKGVRESLQSLEIWAPTVGPRVPTNSANKPYFVEATFDYGEIRLRSNRLSFSSDTPPPPVVWKAWMNDIR